MVPTYMSVAVSEAKSMRSRTDYKFQISGRPCLIRNVPCYDHHGAISFDMDVVGKLPIIKDKMLIGEIPYDVDYELIKDNL